MRRAWLLRGWRLAVLLAIVITAFLLLIAQDQETIQIESPIAATDPQFVTQLAALVGAPVQHGDTYTVLRNGDAFPPMLDAIVNARRTLNFETYVYEDGKTADQFTLALAAAAKRGVAVRVVLDAVGVEMSRQSSATLTEAGVQLCWFNPIRPWSVEETNYRTHRKILVVDGQVAFTGGIGVADDWLGDAQDEDHWRDTHFKITGPSVRAVEASFYENWLEAGGRSVPTLDPVPALNGMGATSVVIWSNPTAGVSNVKLLYLLSIAAARQRIDLQSPYILLDESTRRAIDEARNRGVHIRIVTESEITDAKPVKYASREGYQQLLDKGIEIYEYQPTLMHVKAMIVDGVWSLIGSANFDNRSFELNDELTIAVADETLASELTRDFEADMRKSKRLDAETWPRRSFVEKTRETFWAMFGEIF